MEQGQCCQGKWLLLALNVNSPSWLLSTGNMTEQEGSRWTLSPMSVPSSDWPHQGESLTPPEPGPPANSDSDPGHLPDKHPEETSAQDPKVLSLGLPCLDTDGASTWPGLRILLQQLPPQDSDERYCLAFEEDELAELRLFCAQRRREALGQGVACLVLSKLVEHTCEKCRELLRPGEYGVLAARAGERRRWHPACFACQACGQALIDLIYFYHDGHLYCGRHHAELLRPRCPACDQLIFSRRCTEAEGRRWHENHFCCQDCAGPLGGGRYAVPGGGPCCPRCFERRYSAAGSSQAPALEGRASPGKGGEGADPGGRGQRLGLGRGGDSPGPGPSPRSHAVPSPHRTPQTRASGPAALTARPWPERFQGLPSPARATVGAAARDSLPDWGRGRPLLGSGGDARGRGKPGSGVAAAAAAARTARGRGGIEAGPQPEPASGARPPRIRERGLPALRPAFLARPATGEAGLDRAEDAAAVSRAALPAAASRFGPEAQRGPLPSSPEQEDRAGDRTEAPQGQERGRLEKPLDAREDASCPTCSSSSDSEPEGFFLGQRLPGPWKSPGSLQAGDSDTSRRHCAIC
ncbi:prickle-like protein 4 isoform X1 [Vulpes lagopus]|uniref:prickle-like protein 4 isoform X1 n=2 Tax=Vulpes lagopus TaxID=494514 RepID=UPI001BC95A34|nr:prickle-like protein 4 isoform X1 [Vulpes lagopus]